jgi:predicted TIM-barrel fold metal-dependent hydrolase
MTNRTGIDDSTPLVVVSSDTHIGPRYEDLEPYCPSAWLDRYREWLKVQPPNLNPHQHPGGVRRFELNQLTAGHYDMRARLADMDDDGVAAGLILHGSQNGQSFPFGQGSTGIDFRDSIGDLEMDYVGIRMYNRWIADQCRVSPERHIGVAYIPAWDPDLSRKEMEWARAAGLRGVNLPAPRPYIPEYDDPVWEPVWAASADLDMPLVNHAGAAVAGIMSAGHKPIMPLIYLELIGAPTRRGLGRLTFAGAFERHANLKIVLVEQPGTWWESYMRDMDVVWRRSGRAERLRVPRAPSEYAKDHVFVGASFMARTEAEAAAAGGYAKNVIWGSDYPHREGTWAYRQEPAEPSRTRIALHDAFTGLPGDAIRAMTSGAAARAFALDMPALRKVAERVGAPSISQLAAPMSAEELGWIDRYRDFENDFSEAFRIPEEVGVSC